MRAPRCASARPSTCTSPSARSRWPPISPMPSPPTPHAPRRSAGAGACSWSRTTTRTTSPGGSWSSSASGRRECRRRHWPTSTRRSTSWVHPPDRRSRSARCAAAPASPVRATGPSSPAADDERRHRARGRQMSHPDLDAAAQARLVALTDTDAPADVPAVVEVPAPVPAKRWKRKMVDAARPVADPALDRLAALVAARIRHTMRSEYDELVANVELMRAEHAAMLHALDGVNAFGAGGAATRIDALETNGELMKAELAAFRSSLDGIGQAIAPAAGIAGVPARFAELREQLNALDRRVRAAAPVADAAPSTASP